MGAFSDRSGLSTDRRSMVMPVGEGIAAVLDRNKSIVMVLRRDERFVCPKCLGSTREQDACIFCLGSGVKLSGSLVSALPSLTSASQAPTVARQRELAGTTQVGYGYTVTSMYVFRPDVKVSRGDYVVDFDWDCSAAWASSMGVPRRIRNILKVESVVPFRDLGEVQGLSVMGLPLRTFIKPVCSRIKDWYAFFSGRQS